ncbi:hypothetical protein [Streptomyces sp. NPDC060002]|uniref:MmyB family transcriptional regulator n=1 Tax=Streptomyces sp. NPDC060002 TaxID=3347033 RepID=UPI0036BA17D9
MRELIGELSTLSPEFRSQWAAHDVRIRHEGIKRLWHPEVGDLELTYQPLDLPLPLPLPHRTVHDLTLYTMNSRSRRETCAAPAGEDAGRGRRGKAWS